MFIEFTVGNYKSFKDPVTLSMLASKRKSRNRALDEGAIFKVSNDISLLKCAAIYGANASGKSNLIKAISFFKNFVLLSSKESQVGEHIDVTSFLLSSEFSSKPSNFSISFIIDDDVYQYSVEASSIKIISETLTVYDIKTSKNSTLFERNEDKIKPRNKFPEGKGLELKTRANALFLSVCANFDGPISTKILKWFRRIRVISGLDDRSFIGYTSQLLANTKSKSQIMTILEGFDLGIDDFQVEEFPVTANFPKVIPAELQPVFNELKKYQESQQATETSLSSVHFIVDGNGKPFDKVIFNFARDESEGTKKIVALAGPIYDALKRSLILFIDEFDARLHSHLARNLIKIFNSIECNPSNAQLVAITHDTNLLDNNLLRRDQIWFVGKDSQNASQLHSLVEFKVRNNAIFQKEYDAGKYGAIPFVGDNRKAFCNSLMKGPKLESLSEGEN